MKNKELTIEFDQFEGEEKKEYKKKKQKKMEEDNQKITEWLNQNINEQ